MNTILILIAAIQLAPGQWLYSFGQSERQTPHQCQAAAEAIRAKAPPGVEIIALCESAWTDDTPPSRRKRK